MRGARFIKDQRPFSGLAPTIETKLIALKAQGDVALWLGFENDLDDNHAVSLSTEGIPTDIDKYLFALTTEKEKIFERAKE